jgi:2-dehydro-3-deoxyphosphogluconate aldolase / (4S)-4-hydroxy-2-oxoglutarate aldolase
MPFLRLVPTGGVTPVNVGDWLRAGAVAVGLGGALVDPKRVAAGDWAALTERARMVAKAVAAARGGAA